MGTKTIGLQDEVYERLKARKREDESFTDLVDRLLDDATADWHDGFGTLSTEEADDLERAVAASRQRTSEGLSERQRKALEVLTDVGEDRDEAA